MRNEKKGSPVGNEAPCPPFHRKWRDELMYLLNPSGLTGLEPRLLERAAKQSDQFNMDGVYFLKLMLKIGVAPIMEQREYYLGNTRSFT